MRLKYRFFVVQVDFEAADVAAVAPSLTSAELFAALRASFAENYGEVGAGAGAQLLACLYYSPVTRLGILRGAAPLAAQVHAAIALIRTVRKVPAAVRVLQVASTRRALRDAMLRIQESLVAAMRSSAARDALVLDAAFLDALDADLDDALS